jgi:hypothetical protein
MHLAAIARVEPAPIARRRPAVVVVLAALAVGLAGLGWTDRGDGAPDGGGPPLDPGPPAVPGDVPRAAGHGDCPPADAAAPRCGATDE